MSVTVTLVFGSVEEATDFFSRHATPQPAPGKPAVVADAPPKTAKANPPAPTKTEAPAAGIDRATVSKAAVALAIKDKAKAVAILAEHDVKAVKDLPDDQLGAVHAKLVAAMGE